MDLPPTKPYMVRAIHQWCCDNGFTPYLAVAVDERTLVPREHVRDGQIVLNVGYEATAQLTLGNESISFLARFGGVAREIMIPMGNVAAIYARENGAGMAFDPTSESSGDAPDALSGRSGQSDNPPEPPTSPPGRPRLQRVK